MDTPREDGTTPRQHLDQAAQQLRRPTYEEPELPAAGVHLVDWLGEFSPGSAQSYVEIEAWCRLTGRRVTPTEVMLMAAMDRER